MEQDINELLKDTWFYNKINVSTVGEEAALVAGYAMEGIINDIRLIILALLLVLVLIIQNAYLYLKVYASQTFARKILGHNPLRIFSRMIVESGSALALAVVVYVLQGFDFKLLSVVAGMELLVFLAVTGFSSRVKPKYVDIG